MFPNFSYESASRSLGLSFQLNFLMEAWKEYRYSPSWVGLSLSLMEQVFQTVVIQDGFRCPRPGDGPSLREGGRWLGAASLTNRTAGRISGLNPDVSAPRSS